MLSVLPDSMVTGVSKMSVPGALLPGDRMPATRVGEAMTIPVPLRMPLERTSSEGAEITLFTAKVPRSTVMGASSAAPPVRSTVPGPSIFRLPVLLLWSRPAKVLSPSGRSVVGPNR